jgi:uncharacterized protein YwgA
MTENIKTKVIKFPEIKGGIGDINKLKSVIKFILNELTGESTKYKTEIIKLCFIIDYEYSKRFKRENPTSVKYVRYNYGPYSDFFIEAFEQLISEGIIIEVGLPFGIGYNSLSKEESDLNDEIKLFIREIISKYKNYSLKQMKEYIYDLEEFKQTPFGQEISI